MRSASGHDRDSDQSEGEGKVCAYPGISAYVLNLPKWHALDVPTGVGARQSSPRDSAALNRRRGARMAASKPSVNGKV